MKEYIEDRVLEIADYVISTKCTVRAAAKQFGVSKSTVHKDMIERLPLLCETLAEDVREILDINKAERHIRGGIATRLKYKN